MSKNSGYPQQLEQLGERINQVAERARSAATPSEREEAYRLLAQLRIARSIMYGKLTQEK